MKKLTALVLLLIALFIVLFIGTTVYDNYNENHMKQFAKKCGFISTAGISQICQCSGKMINDNSQLNPLFRKVGGVNYYCYEECSNCKCYTGFRDEKKEVDCSDELFGNLTK